MMSRGKYLVNLSLQNQTRPENNTDSYTVSNSQSTHKNFRIQGQEITESKPQEKTTDLMTDDFLHESENSAAKIDIACEAVTSGLDHDHIYETYKPDLNNNNQQEIDMIPQSLTRVLSENCEVLKLTKPNESFDQQVPRPTYSQSHDDITQNDRIEPDNEGFSNVIRIRAKDLRTSELDFEDDSFMLDEDLDDFDEDPDWLPKRDDTESDEGTPLRQFDEDTQVGAEIVERTTEVQYVAGSAEIDHEEIIETNGIAELKRKRKRRNGNRTEKLANKTLRMQGKKYKGVKKNDAGEYIFSQNRPERLMGARHCSKRCDKGAGGRSCTLIDDALRTDTFNAFWKMTWPEKKVYVLGLVANNPTARKITDRPVSRKKHTYVYHLRKDGKNLVVCKSLFLSTLGLKEDTVYNWVQAADTTGIPKSPEPNSDRRKSNNENAQALEFAVEYLNSIPKMPSHYCRADSSKLYLEAEFRSLAEVYDDYKRKMGEEEKPYYSITQFSKVFKDMNLALFQPKKDQCDTCCAFLTGNIELAAYNEHIRKKDEAKASKQADKEKAISERNQIVITMDLQSLLLCPKLEASCLYYKTKLCCHDFTFFDLATGSVLCYFWNETATDLTANSFTTCVIDYLENLDLEGKERIILYSDGCTYQNRNATLANALRIFAMKSGVTVEQKYLEKGHTQMECDSVHSTIERAIDGKDIYIPYKYVEAIKGARKKRSQRIHTK